MISVTPAEFAGQMSWLAGSDVSVVPVEELVSLKSDGHAVSLTFDDAFTNFETTAWPLLRDNGFPATLFVPTLHVGRSNDWAATTSRAVPSLPILDWDSLGLLAEQGVSLGAHTRTHADLRLLSDAEITDEIQGSVDDIMRETGIKASGFAYPYGRVNDRVSRIASQHCDLACTTELRPLSRRENRHRLPRVDAYFMRGPGRLSGYGSSFFKSYIALRNTIRQVRR